MALVRASLAALTATSIGVDGATITFYQDASCTQAHSTLTTQTFAEGQCLSENELVQPALQATLGGLAGFLGSLLGNATSIVGNVSSSLNNSNITGATTARVKVTCEANKVKIATYTTADCSGASTETADATVGQCTMVDLSASIYQRYTCAAATPTPGAASSASSSSLVGATAAAVMTLASYLL